MCFDIINNTDLNMSVLDARCRKCFGTMTYIMVLNDYHINIP